MKQNGERRSVFRKGKGRAFLRFLLGELLLLALVSVGYLFLLQGDLSALIPAPQEGGPASVTEAPLSTATLAPEATAVETIPPTDAPTPAPTSTPLPFDALCFPTLLTTDDSGEAGEADAAGAAVIDVPETADDALKLGMSELYSFSEAGQRVVVVSGYAYIEGLDAANSDIYLLVSNAANADPIALYPAISAPEMENLSFEESSGANLENAFFTARMEISGFGEGAYLLSVVVVNEDRTAMNLFDARTFHFSIWADELAVAE